MRCSEALAVLAFGALSVSAIRVSIDEDIKNRQQCAGMYSRKAWGGEVDPFIELSIDKVEPKPGTEEDPVVSLVIFEWKDEELIGVLPAKDSPKREFICDHENVGAGFCKDTQIGEFIIPDSVRNKTQAPIVTKALALKDPKPIKYPIKKTGYYCVGTYGFSAEKYKGSVEFRNSYGELPAAQIPKLPFYGGLTIVYAVVTAFWVFLYVQNRQDILPVQNYITAMLGILIVEMAMTWGFYDYQNRHGSNAGAKVLMIIVAILNAARNTFSFFLLLIVCMGYGVVKPSLGKTMLVVRGLAIAHFVFGVIYAVASLSVTPDSAGPLVLLVILPLAGTLTAFYVWTLNALNLTMKDLLDRKQNVKAMMYKKLWWCILGSILVIFGFFFINSFSFAGHSSPDFVPDHWQTRWFVLDGWLNLVYLFDIAFIAYLWRPTANNRRFAMSDELAQDDDGFEIASFGGSLDDEEEGISGQATPRPTNANGGPNGNSSTPQLHSNKPQEAPPSTRGIRESLDGEPIFAVGEDADRWSDDDASRDSSERRGLAQGKEH